MRIAILEAGVPPAALVPAFGDYATMTRDLIGAADASVFRVFDGALPEDPTTFDAYVITGSPAGVGDDLPWISPLLGFLRAAAGHAKLVGICFGHQAMAQAFGGTVRRAPQGWGLGLHRYEMRGRADWSDDAVAVSAAASHQDQVIAPPPRTRTIAASTFTPHAMLDYQDHPAISCQFHPEFDPAFSRALLDTGRPAGVSQPQCRAAVALFDAPNDNARLGRWIANFLAGDWRPGRDPPGGIGTSDIRSGSRLTPLRET